MNTSTLAADLTHGNGTFSLARTLAIAASTNSTTILLDNMTTITAAQSSLLLPLTTTNGSAMIFSNAAVAANANGMNSTATTALTTTSTNAEDDSWAQMESNFHGWAISGVFAWAATALSFLLIWQHLRHYTKPHHQRHIVRILLMVPIYAVTAWFTYRYVQLAVPLEFLRSMYEAFVIYQFFGLLLQYLGESESEQKRNLDSKDPVPFLFPFSCWTMDPSSAHFLMDCRIGILQYVVIRPLTTVFALIMDSAGRFHPETMSPSDGFFWYAGVNFVSTSVAMYFVLMFFLVIHRDVAEYHVVSKIMAIKLVVFATFWQSLFLGFLDACHWIPATRYWPADHVAISVQSLLICVEMFLVSVWHARDHCFGVGEFKRAGDGTRTSITTSLADLFNPRETMADLSTGTRHLLRRCYLWMYPRHDPLVNQADNPDDCVILDLQTMRSEIQSEQAMALQEDQ